MDADLPSVVEFNDVLTVQTSLAKGSFAVLHLLTYVALNNLAGWKKAQSDKACVVNRQERKEKNGNQSYTRIKEM